MRDTEFEDPAISELLMRLATSAEATVAGVAAPSLSQRQRTRRLRRAVVVALGTLGCVIALVVAAVLVPSTPKPTAPATVPVLDINPRVNLGIVSAESQVSVNLAHGYVRGAISSAQLGVGRPIALARSGYVIGEGVGVPYVSVSPDLQRILHSWSSSAGMYPAPADNPKDIWLTHFTGSASSAAEYDGFGHSVGAPVSIPTGSIVLGQSGSNLVLEQSPTTQVLELWDPQTQAVVASLGGWDQLAATSTLVAWTSGNVLHIDDSNGTPMRTVLGPTDSWATSVAVSSGKRLAVVWEPRPGSPAALRGRRPIANASHLAVVDLRTGAPVIVSGSNGATGPVAWTPDGSRVFFGESPGGQSPGVATYLLSTARADRLHLPGVSFPEDFGAPTGSLYVWDESSGVAPSKGG